MPGQIVAETSLAKDRRLRLIHGDLTEEAVDAIVNAANSQLAHGGGVAAAIVTKGGASIAEESRAWVRQHGPVTHARPALTTAGNLPAKAVIHAVGPRWGEGQEAPKLRQAVTASLKVAEQEGFRSMSLPAISTGVFGYPTDLAASVIVEAIADHIQDGEASSLEEVRITIIDEPTLEVFKSAFASRWPESLVTE